MLCDLLDISERTYYRHRDDKDSDIADYLLIKEVFNDSMQTYGYRRIKKALLLKHGVVMNEKKILRIMRKYGLMARYITKCKKPHYRRIEENVRPDLVKRHFNVDAPDKVWVTDITYLTLGNKRMYLSTILDLYDGSVVSYKVHHSPTVDLVIETLKFGHLMRYWAKNVIIHSDQGTQYTSHEYKAFCNNLGFQISMSRKGSPLDNAVMENWHSLLKKETLHNNDYQNINEYVNGVFDWIWFYKTERIGLSERQHNINENIC